MKTREWVFECVCRKRMTIHVETVEGESEVIFWRRRDAMMRAHGWHPVLRSLRSTPVPLCESTFYRCSAACQWRAEEGDKLRVKSFETGSFDYEAEGKMLEEWRKRYQEERGG